MTQRLLIVIGLFVSIGLSIVALRWHLRAATLSPEFLAFERSKRQAQLYVPSPLESYALDRVPDLWPGIFSKDTPPRAEEMPLFYTRLARDAAFSALSSGQIEQARQWSMTASAQHLESLGDLLLANPQDQKPSNFQQALALFHPTRDDQCGLAAQERAFRLGQAFPRWRGDARAHFARCAPTALQALWWDLEAALVTRDQEPLRKAAEAFQIQMKESEGDYARWFALEAYQLGHVVAVQGEAAKSTSEEASSN
jgi:hypothetical protein